MKLKPRPKITSEDFVYKWQSWVNLAGHPADSQFSINLLTKMITSQLISQNTEPPVAINLTHKILLSWSKEIEGTSHTHPEVYEVLIEKLSAFIE